MIRDFISGSRRESDYPNITFHQAARDGNADIIRQKIIYYKNQPKLLTDLLNELDGNKVGHCLVP